MVHPRRTCSVFIVAPFCHSQVMNFLNWALVLGNVSFVIVIVLFQSVEVNVIPGSPLAIVKSKVLVLGIGLYGESCIDFVLDLLAVSKICIGVNKGVLF